jgi:hypothetical protein
MREGLEDENRQILNFQIAPVVILRRRYLREEIGLAIGQTEDVVNFRHAGKVLAIEAQDGGTGACP